MAKKRVSALSLNLRRTPEIRQNNVVASLPLATEVEADDTATGRFTEVEAVLVGSSLKGFVSSRFLRPPESAMKEKLLSEAVAQWFRFKQGKGKEHIAPFAGFVGEMWDSIGLDFDGRDTEVPWSAAFISFIVRRAGYAGFKFSAAHATYIVDGIEKRNANAAAAPFWGFKLSERRPQLGDMVCQWRKRRTTFANAVPTQRFPSHCDVVVEVKPKSIKTIGGNVSQSVSTKTFSLNANGFLKNKDRLFAVLANNR